MLECSPDCISSTLAFLRDAGTRRHEGIVLWLGKRTTDSVQVVECYPPIHRAKEDQFHIPPEGMAALQAKLRSQRLMVAAQVHSHPGVAFHSEADDRWAIVRHEGALSLVIPYFASGTTPGNFFEHAKVYQFSSRATWDEVPQGQVIRVCP